VRGLGSSKWHAKEKLSSYLCGLRSTASQLPRAPGQTSKGNKEHIIIYGLQNIKVTRVRKHIQLSKATAMHFKHSASLLFLHPPATLSIPELPAWGAPRADPLRASAVAGVSQQK